jgi:hypothetical protein
VSRTESFERAYVAITELVARPGAALRPAPTHPRAVSALARLERGSREERGRALAVELSRIWKDIQSRRLW